MPAAVVPVVKVLRFNNSIFLSIQVIIYKEQAFKPESLFDYKPPLRDEKY
jgi:hypothetical protein